MTDHKPRIVIDFDGVLHSYTSGWQGAETIADPPTPGAVEFVEFLLRNDWEVVVMSTRAEHPDGAEAIEGWLNDHDFPRVQAVTSVKPPALVYLDDRALRFDGAWPDLKQIEDAATPWNKRG